MNGAGTGLPTRAGREDIVSFVREVLGCGCPDEVFRRLDLGRARSSVGEPDFWRLLVGERLLIYIVAIPDACDLSRKVKALVTRGLADRDHHGYHRFRLVLVSQTAPSAVTASDAFRKATVGDERAHLHCLATIDLPPSLAPPGSRDETGAGTDAPA